MTFKKRLFAVAIGLSLLMTVVTVPRAAAQRVVIRPFGFYGRIWAPAYYPYYYPYGYSYGYPYAGQVYLAGQRAGQVKIDTHLKDASVYVDGGFAGTTNKLKEFSLQSGNHDIEVRDAAGRTLFHNRVQVLLGKRVEIKL